MTLTHLPQTLTIHLMRFSIRNLRAEKVCHSLYFPQNLDLTKLLETKGEPCSAEEQVRALVLLTHKHAHTHIYTPPTHTPWPHQSPCLLSVSLPTPSDTTSFVCLLPLSCPASHTPEMHFGFGASSSPLWPSSGLTGRNTHKRLV